MTEPKRIEGQIDVVEMRPDGVLLRGEPGWVMHSNGWAVMCDAEGLAFIPHEPGPQAPAGDAEEGA
jgi:hypothetical protein